VEVAARDLVLPQKLKADLVINTDAERSETS